MTALPGEHGWSADALFKKALVYVQKMEEHSVDDWEYGFWASLSLEFLCRAAVAKISPTLLAAIDKKNWRSVHYALGGPRSSIKFVPKSADISDVFEILAELVPGFTASHAFCIEFTGRRNAELHSGSLEFQGLETGSWLPRFYAASKTLLASMGKDLKDLFADPATAVQLIAASEDDAAKSVNRDIKAYSVVWSGKTADEQAAASAAATAWASREKGHRAECPACHNIGLVRGAPQGAVGTTIKDDEIVEKQTVIPSSFECVACGLKISGLAKLVACGLGNTFTATSTSTPAEFFGLYTEDDITEARDTGPQFDDDYNE
ncbi:MAG TPA: hypothetical protein VHT05_11765 [Candidatus Elarobacter sp.]|jgi:hypothetical protein|nr:hypothetical protein [Candidatus Elarobacter sp.]